MKKAIAIAGLLYGDEGKGTITDYLVRQNRATLVVRYNGGGQAAHNVVTNEGLHHTFSQLGSGSFAHASTYVSRYMLFDPLAFENEYEIFQRKADWDPWVSIDPMTVLVTPFHRYLNQWRETMRGNSRHGSCGCGIGETRRLELEGFAIRVQDMVAGVEAPLRQLQELCLKEIGTTSERHRALVDEVHIKPLVDRYRHILFHRIDMIETFDEVASRSERVVFEGAQGVMLDEKHGFEPYNTWTDCTFGNVHRLLQSINYSDELERIAVMRTYLTRHGAGPLLTEDQKITWPAEAHNSLHPWMGPMRFGHFDVSLAQQALRHLGDVEGFALTHLDQIPSKFVSVGHRFTPDAMEGVSGTDAYLRLKPIYYTWKPEPDAVIAFLEKELRYPVRYTSHGPATNQKQSRNHQRNHPVLAETSQET